MTTSGEPLALRYIRSVRWRWGQHWLLSLLVCLGMIAIIALACAVPLLSYVMSTAGLRSTLTTSYTASELDLRLDMAGLSSSSTATAFSMISATIQSHLATYLDNTSSRLDIETPGFPITTPQQSNKRNTFSLLATNTPNTTSHISLLQGRLPTASKDLEIALTPEAAAQLGVHVGSTITLQLTTFSDRQVASAAQQGHNQPLVLDVVGLFHVKSADPFWHATDFLPEFQEAGIPHTSFTALTSDQALLSEMDQLAQGPEAQEAFFAQPSHLEWFYRLDPARISSAQLDDLLGQLRATQIDLAKMLNDLEQTQNPPYISSPLFFSAALGSDQQPGLLAQFHDHLDVLNTPFLLLALLLAGLLFFFLFTMLELFIDRRLRAIAWLRGRGANGIQIISPLLWQMILLGLISLLAGPLLALLATVFLVRALLPPDLQNVLALLTQNPTQTLFDNKMPALIMALVAFLVMLFALLRVARLDTLTLTRETTRSSRRPLWLRFYLDILAAIIALAGFALATYLANSNNLIQDAKTQVLLTTPLSLLAPLFLLLALALLLLRGFPWLLYLSARLAARGRGAVAMLALTQTARAPRQALRMTILLALALAFTSFSLAFAASQNQRANDVAAYRAGADFSGTIPLSALPHSLASETALYAHISGVRSASAGFVGTATSSGLLSSLDLSLRAIDPTTFARTILWTAPDTTQTLNTLMARLLNGRAAALRSGTLPAIVDAATAQSLALHTGSIFVLHPQDSLNENLSFQVVATVQYLPTQSDASSGILVDYQALATVLQQKFGDSLALNTIWLRSDETPAGLESIRAALATRAFHLDNLADRQALLTTLATDPLALNLVGLLAAGALLILLLTLLGALLSSWINVRLRQNQLVVLRALGMTSGQIAAFLFWEQSLVYLAALLLGGLFGALLAFAVVPDLTFVSVSPGNLFTGTSSNAFYTLQTALPVRVVFPASLLFVGLAFVLVCGGLLLLMLRLALRPRLYQELRVVDEGQIDFATPTEVRRARARTRRQAKTPPISLPAFLRLLRWRTTHSRLLLALEGGSLTIAVTLVCLVTLLASIGSTIGLDNVLNTSPAGTEITLATSTEGISNHVVQDVQRQLDSLVQSHLGSYLSTSIPFSLQTSGFTLSTPAPTTSHYTVGLFGEDLTQATANLTLVQGHLPHSAPVDGAVETLLTPSVASHLHVSIGSLIALQMPEFSYQPGTNNLRGMTETLRLRVVGLFNPTAHPDAAWAATNFAFTSQNNQSSYPLLAANSALLDLFDQMAAAQHVDTILSPQTFELLWYYNLDSSRITADHLPDLSDQLTQLQTLFTTHLNNLLNKTEVGGVFKFPYVIQANLFNPVVGAYELPGVLEQYRQHLAIFNLPLAVLTLQIFGLILFFIAFIVTLLIERQSATMATLRSRGGNDGQVAGPLLAQVILLGVFALIIGPFLALLLAQVLVQHLFTSIGPDALGLFFDNPLNGALTTGWYALATVAVSIGLLSLLIWRSRHKDLRAVRAETARASSRPLWQLLNLDLVAALLALTGYVLSLYLSRFSSSLNTQSSILITTPLMLIAPFFLLLAGLLFLLRGFPLMLRVGERLSRRSKGAVSQIALAQMARAPRQSQRTTILLILTIAFAIFTLIFSSSQSQRSTQLASYLAGADFSGDIAPSARLSLAQVTQKYTNLPGVISASAGFDDHAQLSGTDVSAEIRAVDIQSFARTATGTTGNSSISLATALRQLQQSAASTTPSSSSLPVIVDSALAYNADLSVGSVFAVEALNLPEGFGYLPCNVVAIVKHIPGVTNTSTADSGNATSPSGGILLDYNNYATYYKLAWQYLAKQYLAVGIHLPSTKTLPINHIWLHTQDSQQALASIRNTLNNSPELRATNLYDRREIEGGLGSDPLQTSVLAFLTLGTWTALGLALLGNLLASWLSVRLRLTGFTVLRALGTTRFQITRILLWEQLIIYGTAIGLGALMGTILTVTIIPALTFTNLPANGVLSQLDTQSFYLLQRALPVQIVVPPVFDFVFIFLLAICALALLVMLRAIHRFTISQVLRLSED